MTQVQENLIRLPFISRENLISAGVVTSYVRKGGVRISHQLLGSKNIYHNYGYGTDEVILGYGSSNLAAKLISIKFDVREINQCAVLGAGAAGLLTALELAKNGHKVTLYSDKFTEFRPKAKGKERTIAIPRVWMPNQHDWSTDPLRHELLSKVSYDYFKQSLRINKYQSMRAIKAFDFVKNIDDLREVISQVVYDTFTEANVHFENKQVVKTVKYTTLFNDSSLFLEELRLEAQLRGIKLVERKFTRVEDVLSLSESFIFNCIASASSYLFGETELEENRKLVLEFKVQSPPKQEFQLIHSNGKFEPFEIFSLRKKIYVVSSPQSDNLEQAVQATIKTVGKFIEQHSLMPKL